jgi:pilus assembly protein CpaB
MRSKKPILLLVLAVGCGLAASIGISQVLSQKQESGPVEETAPLWVAMVDIKPNDSLSAQNLKLEQWPKERIPPGALSTLEQINGKKTRAALYQGEPVLEKKLAGKEPGITDLMPPKGFRLFTVQADSTNSFGGLLHPDDRVDVVLYIPKGIGNLDAGTKTILQDIRVFAVNDVTRPNDNNKDEAIQAKTVTLLVTPTQAEKASLASEIGKIRLVMRAPGDDGTVGPEGQSLTQLLNIEKSDRKVEEMNREPQLKGEQPRFARAAPAPTATALTDDPNYTMQIIKGTDITQSVFHHKWDDPTRWENGSYSAEGQDPPKAGAPAAAPASAAAPSPAPAAAPPADHAPVHEAPYPFKANLPL